MKLINNISALVLTLIVGVAMCSCGGNSNKQESEEKEDEAPSDGIVTLTDQQLKVINVTIGRVEEKQLSGTIQATGTLKLSPQNRAEVTSLITGITRRILVKDGDVVGKGQTLALVENTDIVAMQKDYLVASRQLLLARQAYQRQQTIREQGAGAEKNLQQAKSDLDIASVTEQGLRQQLSQLGISCAKVAKGQFSNTYPVKAPISGVVGEVLISTGSYLSSDKVLMNIYDNSALHADVNVFESDIASIRIGQSVDLILSNKTQTPLTGKVSFITASMDKESKSASVHVDIDKKNGQKLLPNMFVSASIHCEKQTCLAVPDDAIVMNADHKYVFVSLGAGKFQQTEVVTGISQSGYTQITFVKQQSDDVKVVTSKAFYLQSMIADHGEEE